MLVFWGLHIYIYRNTHRKNHFPLGLTVFPMFDCRKKGSHCWGEVEHIKGVKSPDDEQVTVSSAERVLVFSSDNMRSIVPHCVMKDESLIL